MRDLYGQHCAQAKKQQRYFRDPSSFVQTQDSNTFLPRSDSSVTARIRAHIRVHKISPVGGTVPCFLRATPSFPRFCLFVSSSTLPTCTFCLYVSVLPRFFETLCKTPASSATIRLPVSEG